MINTEMDYGTLKIVYDDVVKLQIDNLKQDTIVDEGYNQGTNDTYLKIIDILNEYMQQQVRDKNGIK